MPVILGLKRILVGNETTTPKIDSTEWCCAILQKDVNHSSPSSLWISSDRTKEDYIQDCEVFDKLFMLWLLLLLL